MTTGYASYPSPGASSSALRSAYIAATAVPVLAAVGYPQVFGAMGGLTAAILGRPPAANRTAEHSD